MKQYNVKAQYTITVNMVIEADSYDEAMDIAYGCNDCIHTEWNGSSVFAEPNCDNGVIEMSVEADGMLYDFDCDEEDDD